MIWTDATQYVEGVDYNDMERMLSESGKSTSTAMVSSNNNFDVDVLLEPRQEEVSYEFRIWDHPGTDVRGILRTLTPFVRNLESVRGTVSRESDAWSSFRENYLENEVVR